MKKFLKNIIRYLNIVFAVLLLLTYLSTFISPKSVPWLAFFGLAYPYLLLINLFFIGFWISRKNWLFIISLLAILAGWNHIDAFFQLNIFNKKPQLSEKNISVMSYNVRLFDLYNWSHNKSTKKKMFDFLKSEKPDIICFQEFYYDETNNYPTRDSIIEFDNLNYYHDEYTQTTNDVSHYGIATFSSYPIIRKGSLKFM